MRIERVRIHQVRLPFKNHFAHARNRGVWADNVVVEMVAEKGQVTGYGECAPRSYVTGERQDTAVGSIGLFLRNPFFPWDLDDVSQIWSFVDALGVGREHNAALCALELALLDGMGRSANRSVGSFFPGESMAGTVSYGGSLPLASREKIVQMCDVAKRMHLKRMKAKMGPDLEQNREILEGVREVFGSRCDLKIDVNGAWDCESALRHLPMIVGYGIRAVEQPLMPKDPSIAQVAEVFGRHNIRLMADESACTFDEVAALLAERGYDMINVRLSKMGGLRRSLRVVELLRKSKTPFQVGCQLGESGILSAAGRVLSLLCPDAWYHDGSYDEFLLEENITRESVSFGLGGEAGPLEGAGFGVEVERTRLRTLRCGSSAEFSRP